jgi:hypothetical protein
VTADSHTARCVSANETRIWPTDGNIEDIIFRPDGDGTRGEILTCAQEQTLKAVRDTVPVQLMLWGAGRAAGKLLALRVHTCW